MAGGGTINVTNGTGTIGSTPQAAPAIIANGVALNANFTSVSSSGGANGISLTSVTGTSNFGAGSLTGASGAEFLVSAGSPTVTYNGTVTQNNAQRVVDVQGTTSGTVSFGGTVTGGASSTGIHIGDTTTANGNINFTTLNLGTSGARMTNQAVTITGGSGTKGLGAVSIFTNNVNGIHASGSTGTISSSSGEVNTTGAAAVNIAGTSSASRTPLNMQLTKVNSTGSSTNGIIIQNTSASPAATGGFRVLGSSAGICGGSVTNTTTPGTPATVTAPSIGDCTGGTITSTGDGVRLISVENVVLTRMYIHDSTDNGVFGTEVNGFQLISSYLFNNGNNGGATTGDRGLKFRDTANPSPTNLNGLVGTATNGNFPTRIINSKVSQSAEFNVEIVNRTGTITDLVVDGSQFTDTNLNASPFDADGFNMEMQNTSAATVHFSNSFFSNNYTQGAQVSAIDSANLTVTVTSSTFTGNNEGFICNHSGPSDLNCTVGGDTQAEGNTFQGGTPVGTPADAADPTGAQIVLSTNSTATASSSLIGKVKFNHVTSAPMAVNHSIIAFISGHLTPASINISNNTVIQTNFGNNIRVDTPDTTCSGVSCDPIFSVIANNNNVTNNAPAGHGVLVQARKNSTSCVLVQNNTGTVDTASGSEEVRVRQADTATFRLKQGGSSSTDPLTVLQNNNPGVTLTATSVSGTINVVSNSTCTTPSQTPDHSENTKPESASGEMPGNTPMQQIERAATSNSQPVVVPAQPVESQASAPGFVPEIKKLYTDWLNEDVSWIIAADVSVRTGQLAQEAKTGNTKATTPPAAVTAAPAVANFPVTIGTLGAGKTVTITFSVTVNNLLSSSVTQISNQGTVSGANFANVLTDDPDVAGQQATITGVIPQPTINIKNASVPRPVSGTTTMPFTVTLSNVYTVPVTVSFQTADGTATAGTDYTTTSGTLNFPAGVTVQTASVPVLSNAAAAGDKTFTVTLSAPTNSTLGSSITGTGTITAANTPGTVLISEFRTSGPGTSGTGNPDDDFVEVYNNTNSPITVAASDASTGWALVKGGATCADQPVIIGTIPNGTVIPARGHYLFVGSSYSLSSYATGNQTFTANIEDDKPVALFNTANALNFATGTRLDAVGGALNSGNNCDLLREGGNPPATSGSLSQYSFARTATSGTPQDTNSTLADFQLVSTTPAVAVGDTTQPGLGAPGPENLASPIQRNATIKPAVVDPGAAATAAPNRVRDTTPNSCTGGANCALGTLTIRRKFTNTTGAAVTRLRFRIVDITTATAPAGTADLRALTSADVTINLTGGGTLLVRGLTLETPPAQPNGGGLNSTLAAGIVTAGTPIANGASINVGFTLGVQQGGSFRFFINVEALP